MTISKPWYQSRTLISNIILIVVFTLGLIADSAGALQIDPRVVIVLGIAVAVGNMILRLVTSTAIVGTPAAAAALPIVITTAPGGGKEA